MDARRRSIVCAIALASLLVAWLSSITGHSQAGRGGPRTPPARDREHVIEGTKADDVLDGGDGDDWLFGYEGNDVLRGAAGHDTIDGATGDDMLVGGPGRDVLDGGAGRDNLLGGEDNDWLDGGDDDDTIDGGPGNDDMDGGDADDTINGGAGDDIVAGSDGNDSLSGGDGADRVLGLDGDDRMAGGPGNDRLEGGDGRDSIAGDDGNDTIDGGEGDDTLRGGAGDDTITGESGNDVLIGEGDNDTLLGSRGDDSLDGGDGHDSLLGGDGDDVVTGGPGDDFLLGGLGVDTTRAGTENDVIVIRAGDVRGGASEIVDAGAGQDTVVLVGFGPVDVATLTGSAAERTLIDPITGGTYRLYEVEQVQHAQVFTTVASAEKGSATFTFVNPAAKTPAGGRVLFFDADGGPLPRAVDTGTAQPSHSFTVPPLGRIGFDATGPAQKGRGTAFVLADQPLTGMVRTSAPDLGPLVTRESRLLDQFMVPVVAERASNTDTGVALFSSSVASLVKLTLRRPTGEEVATESQGGAEIEIPANGHRVVFVKDLFPWVGGDFQGAMTIEGGIDRPQVGGPLAGIGLQRDAKSGAVSPVPVVPIGVPPVAGNPPAPMFFANVRIAPESRAAITLLNPSLSVIARGALSFFDQAGMARPVSVNGLTASAVVQFEVPPLGSVVFATPSTGASSMGSARVRVTAGTVGAVLRSGVTAGPAVHVEPGVVASSVAAPVRRTAAVGVDTQIWLSSTESALGVSLVLRDGRGAEISAGRAEIKLPANGSAVQSLGELFPKADLSDFQGTLSISTEGGTFAITIVEINPQVGNSVMPISRIR